MIKVCSLFSGSSGNCIFVSYNDTAILIDAGVSGRRIEAALADIGESFDKIAGIFITHEHSDHISGAGILSRRHNVPIYANADTWNAMRPLLGKLKTEHIRYIEPGESATAGDITVKPFPIPHDAVCPVGYNIFVNGKKLTIATDIGHMDKELLTNLEKSEMILLESNHDVEMLKTGRYPWHLKQRILGEKGHLCNDIAGKVVAYLAKNGTKKFLLGHLSKENNFPELAYQTVCNALMEMQINPKKDIYLEVALRDKASNVMYI
ncbi:MAG: MBL fold metallo-hydrolase [Clostridiaceae bacterium]|jgi:phosphoribosyl 1,2-cyclic phosphodiesterase|nr:MBL fold metallo-hydrolase [Clostridiaceae bacterium]